ncbi:MAG: DUF3667 domain-containing protein [Cytophagaceae bacterium]|nr:DUF3667 domain-containing protein [Cytophagaceae bacterium]
MSEAFLSAFHIEKKGLLYTVKELSLRPGHAIRKVIEGQRLSLYPPFKYLLLMGAIVVLFSLRYKFFHNEVTSSHADNPLYALEFVRMNSGFFDGFFQFAEDKATILNLVAIPIFTLFSWLFFKEYSFNLAENLILNTFITAHQLFFLLWLSPLIEYSPAYKSFLIPLYTLATMGYNVWVYVQFFQGRIWLTTYKGVMVVLTAYLYQLPANMLLYYVYVQWLEPNFHWIPNNPI